MCVYPHSHVFDLLRGFEKSLLERLDKETVKKNDKEGRQQQQQNRCLVYMISGWGTKKPLDERERGEWKS